jgi:homoserine kinase
LCVSRRVSCRAPASSANIGPGFDAFSIGLEEPCLDLTLEYLGDGVGVEMVVEGAYASRVPQPYENLAAVRGLKAYLKRSGIEGRFLMKLNAGIPIAKGLGSSGAEAVAAIVAADTMYGSSLSTSEKIALAASAEPGGHADNVVASLLGGFNIVDTEGDEIHYMNIQPPEELGIVVIVPSFEKESTEKARGIFREGPSLREYAHAVSRASIIAAAMALGRLEHALRLIPQDPYVEVVRANSGLYGPGYDWNKLQEEKRYLIRNYGVALCISGAGPSRLLLYDKSRGGEVLEESVNYLADRLEKYAGGVERVIYTQLSRTGVVVTENL